MSEIFKKRKKAFYYALAAYRDQDFLEECHSKSVTMNEDFYWKTVEMLKNGIQEYREAIETVVGLIGKSVDETKTINSDPKLLRVAGYYYQTNIWGEPSKVRDRFNVDPTDNNIAQFVLNGAFKKACQSGERLDDGQMAIINPDLYNRLFTLVCRGIL